MLASFLLSLREGIEAALVIGITLGVLLKLKRSDLIVKVWQGTGTAVVISGVAAVALNFLGMEFEGKGEQIFEGSALLIAAGVLSWMILWMREHASNLKNEIEVNTRQAVSGNGRKAIFLLAFLAVVREGIELALFLLAARLTSNPLQMFVGALFGLVAAIVLGWVIFTSAGKLSLRGFFASTNALLIIFAAGMVGLGIHEFNEAGLIPSIVEHVWDLSPILSDSSGLGLVLKALVGYNSSPSLASVIGYFTYLAVIVPFLFGRKQVALATTV